MKNKFKISGDTVTIFLNRQNGDVMETIIDTANLKKVQEFPNTWMAHWDQNRQQFYCDGKLPRKDGKSKRVSLHRYLLEPPKNLVVDHINHNSLDNRSCNLRVITNAQNYQNKNGLNKNNKTGVRGVSWCKSLNTWRVSIRREGKYIYQNNFKEFEDAKAAAEEAIKKYLPYAEK